MSIISTPQEQAQHLAKKSLAILKNARCLELATLGSYNFLIALNDFQILDASQNDELVYVHRGEALLYNNRFSLSQLDKDCHFIAFNVSCAGINIICRDEQFPYMDEVVLCLNYPDPNSRKLWNFLLDCKQQDLLEKPDLLRNIVEHLLLRLQVLNEVEEDRSERIARETQQMLYWVMLHMCQPLSLPQVAERYQLTPQQLNRRCNRYIGDTLFNSVNRHKAVRATYLLSQTKGKPPILKEAAALTGFKNSTLMKQFFLQHADLNITIFRRACRDKSQLPQLLAQREEIGHQCENISKEEFYSLDTQAQVNVDNHSLTLLNMRQQEINLYFFTNELTTQQMFSSQPMQLITFKCPLGSRFAIELPEGMKYFRLQQDARRLDILPE